MTTYNRNGYTDRHRSSRAWNEPQPQDAPATATMILEALKFQSPDVQDAVVSWAASLATAPTIGAVHARIGRERTNHPVSVGSLVSA